MDKREKFINILKSYYIKYDGENRYYVNGKKITNFKGKNHYSYNYFYGVKQLDNDIIDKTILLYESKTNEPLTEKNRLLILNCLYEIIKDSPKFDLINDELMKFFKIELDYNLIIPVKRYDDFDFVETDEITKLSYGAMPEYSLILLEMYIRKMHLLYENMKISKNEFLADNILSIYEDIRGDLLNANIKIPEDGEKIYLDIKSLIISIKKEKELLIEQEKHQKEIDSITLPSKINEIEKEIIDIKKMLFQLTSGKLFSSFENRFARKYPKEYNDFKSYYNKVSKYKSTYSYENDLRNKFSSISTELEFYKEALKVYENFNMRYNQMVVEVEEERKLDKGIGAIKEVLNKINSKVGTPISARISRKYPEEYKNFIDYCDKLHDYKYLGSFKDKWEEYEFYEKALEVYGKFDMRYNQMVAEIEEERKNENEKKKILDLIYSDEKLRYKLISSYPVGVRVIPEEFKGMSYAEVKEVLDRRKEQEKNEQLNLKEDLIIKAIKRFYGKNDSYQLSEEEINNIRYKFEEWTIDMLKDYIDRFDAILMKYKVVNGEIVYNDDIFEKKDDFVSSKLNKDDKRNVLISKTLEKMFPNGVSEKDLMSKEFSDEFIKTMNSVSLDDLNQTSSRRR